METDRVALVDRDLEVQPAKRATKLIFAGVFPRGAASASNDGVEVVACIHSMIAKG